MIIRLLNESRAVKRVRLNNEGLVNYPGLDSGFRTFFMDPNLNE